MKLKTRLDSGLLYLEMYVGDGEEEMEYDDEVKTVG